MHCHQAGIWEAVMAGALLALWVLLGQLSGKARLALDAASALLCVLAMLLPGGIISMCMMSTMRCHAVMAPAVRVFAGLILVLSAADAWGHRKGGTEA